MKASIIILAWNGKPYLEACLDAVQVLDYPDFEILVVDNASTDGSADWVATHYPLVRVIRNASNLGFAAGNNVGLTAASGEVFVLLNQDTVVHPGWLSALVEGLQIHTGSGVVGSKILDMDGRTLQHAGGYIQRPLALGLHYGYGEADNGQWDMAQEVEFVTGAALAFKREVYEEIGGLDEGFYPGYFEDVDFCLKMKKADYKLICNSNAVLYHKWSASSGVESPFSVYHGTRSRILFNFRYNRNPVFYVLLPVLVIRLVLKYAYMGKSHLISQLFKGVKDGVVLSFRRKAGNEYSH